MEKSQNPVLVRVLQPLLYGTGGLSTRFRVSVV